jgi:hypothetical protein
MHRLAESERFEEAAATRPAGDARASAATVTGDGRVAAARIVLEADEGRLVLGYGRCSTSRRRGSIAPDLTVPPTEEADELMLVSRWLSRHDACCEHAIGVAASQLPPVADYACARTDCENAPLVRVQRAGGLQSRRAAVPPSAAHACVRQQERTTLHQSGGRERDERISRAIGQNRPQPSASDVGDLVRGEHARRGELEDHDECERDRDDPEAGSGPNAAESGRGPDAGGAADDGRRRRRHRWRLLDRRHHPRNWSRCERRRLGRQ